VATTVVNFRHEKCDVKVTRRPDNSIPDPPKFGCFGNPYPVKTHGRERCLELFDEYFMARLKEDPEFAAAVLALKGKRLGCFCRPKEGFQGKLLCHAQIIAGWLEGVEPTDIA